jgi:RNA polymerase sigma-70 factor (ECF subfamily)
LIDSPPLARPDDDAVDFEEIFVTYYGRVRGLLGRLVGDSEADELASEVFWKLYKQPAAHTLWSNPGAWLYRTATHTGIDALRAAARRWRYESAAATAQSGVSEMGPLQEAIREENCRTVRKVLSSMKPAQAQILLMRAVGASYKEIAESVGVEASSVGTLLSRAEDEFKKRYLKLFRVQEKV